MLQVLSSCYVIFLSWFLGNYFLCLSLTILSHSFHPMCHAFGLEGLHIFFQPWQWGSLSCFLSSVFCLDHNYSCRVSGKEYNLGGWGEGGKEGKAYHHSTLIAFTFPPPPLPWRYGSATESFTLRKVNAVVNPLHHNISIHILHTVLCTFTKVLTRRIYLYVHETLCSRD